ncbi:hypothetical protein NIES39_L05250 [Arthrospira platensis NIES-39]|nr:hypothetical protein NIES39_L05250 [Arthrospira platensis NIES-39]
MIGIAKQKAINPSVKPTQIVIIFYIGSISGTSASGASKSTTTLRDWEMNH